jgi:hypothetical protein
VKRPFTAPPEHLRCIAHASTAVKGEGAQCMRAKKIGDLCRQHADMKTARARSESRNEIARQMRNTDALFDREEP